MTNPRIPKILIAGATGQVGGNTIDFLLLEKEIEIVATVRSPEKAASFTARGIETVILDLDDENTHLPAFNGMENVLSYGGKKTIKDGVINAFVGNARYSWVDVDNVAQAAALALARPEMHRGQTHRLGYDAVTYGELAELMTAIVGQPFRYEPLAPEVFLETMRSAGAEMAYMNCVYDHWKRYAAGTIPGAEDTFDNFPAITRKQPTKWADFIRRHKAELTY